MPPIAARDRIARFKHSVWRQSKVRSVACFLKCSPAQFRTWICSLDTHTHTHTFVALHLSSAERQRLVGSWQIRNCVIFMRDRDDKCRDWAIVCRCIELECILNARRENQAIFHWSRVADALARQVTFRFCIELCVSVGACVCDFASPFIFQNAVARMNI